MQYKYSTKSLNKQNQKKSRTKHYIISKQINIKIQNKNTDHHMQITLPTNYTKYTFQTSKNTNPT